MRTELRKVISRELDDCMKERQETGKGNDCLLLDPSTRVRYTKLENELFIGGVYVTRFLKEPTYNLRDPTSFLEMLLQTWTYDLQMCTENIVTGEEKQSSEVVLGGQDSLQIVTDAIVYLCKVRTNLCEKLSMWGYMSKCLAFLDRILSLDMVGSPLLSVMRILHVAVNRRSNVESLIASGTNDRFHGIIAFTMRAIGDTNLHPDTGFMLEMLKKIFVDALGDVSKASHAETRLGAQIPARDVNYAMAPSPAPGEGRVRVNMGDDPLGLGGPMGTTASARAQPSSSSNTQNHAMNLGAAPTSQYSTYNTHQQQYGLGGQAQQQSFQQVPYGTPAQYPSQPTVYGSSISASTYNLHAHSNQAMSAAQGQVPMMYGSQSFQGRTQHVPPPQHQVQQQHSRFATSSYAQRSAVAHQTAQTPQQHAANASSLMQNGPLGQPPSTATSSYPTNSGYMPQSGHGNGWTTTGQSQVTVNQSQYAMQSGQTTQTSGSLLQQSPPSQDPLNQRWSTTTTNNAGFVGSETLGMQQRQSLDGTSGSSSQYHVNQTLPIQNVAQNHSSQPSSHHTQPFQTPTSNTYNSAQPNQATFQQPANASQNSYAASNYQQQSPNIQPNQTNGTPPIVETVTDGNTQSVGPAASTSTPPVMDGTGIDARTKVEPTVEAAKRAASTQGAPGSAEGRKALLESALQCDLPTFLVESVLENATLSNVKDQASVKVHAVELLKLLCQDPGYGLKFKLVLEKIPAWKKYVAQDHSLFITGHEQKTDYFLTDGGSSDPKKLLTQG